MFCPHCGHELADDARFCSECGQALPEAAEGAAAKASPEKPTESTTSTTGNLGSQVSEIRGRGRRRMPLMLFVVLVALGVATAAFAATMAWKYIIAPALEQRQAEPVEAAQTAEVATVAGASTEPATTEPATTEPAATTVSVAAQQAVFNDTLAKYKVAQDSGWAVNESDPDDLKALEYFRTGTVSLSNASVDVQVSYAFTDIGNDGVLDLVVGGVKPDEYAVYAIFLGNNGSPTSVMEGDLGARSWYYVLANGTIVHSGSGGAHDRVIETLSIENGTPVVTDKYGVSSNGPNGRYYYHNSDNTLTEEEFDSLTKSNGSMPKAQLDWKPLSEFTPVQQ